MFTGIIHSVLPIYAIDKKNDFYTHTIKFPKFLLNKLMIGSSISYNGCCLTVSKIENNLISFDIIKETLHITNIKILKTGDFVNIERAANFNSEIGGHFMYGHITCTALISNITSSYKSKKICFIIYKKQPNFMKYILNKGSIGIDGVSVTISYVTDNYFCVDFIPNTLKYTTFKIKKIGDIVNIEIDIYTKAIIDTVEKKLKKLYRK